MEEQRRGERVEKNCNGGRWGQRDKVEDRRKNK